ncbi:hypothetical protein PNEG_02012 [Pneumocystis murina B123]|uniref:Sepiapterin reductase n=1 Tax=Pneumocystis murina (strain B123) TaxID=1069680 RepID=M7NRV7_PNEMU|nr:hypothetical protein PNEG_02012 [Pneumocystis murina B123]EMR09831.1 hypothetical protein PNEG_02012 [Pneumocystis murina B123]
MVLNKTILVTGASRGIGRAIVEELLESYKYIFVVAVVRSRSSLATLQEKFESRIAIVEGDLKDEKTNVRSVNVAIERFGRLDSLILNAAAIEPVGKIADIDVNSWKALFDVNYFSLLYILKSAIPYLRSFCGRVIFISSGASIKPYKSMGAYSGSKAAMNHLSSVLAAEESSITSISFRPGVVDTQMQTSLRENYSSNLDKDMHTRFMDLYQTGQLIPPEKIARIIVNLALNAKKELSGRFISYDDKELMEYEIHN